MKKIDENKKGEKSGKTLNPLREKNEDARTGGGEGKTPTWVTHGFFCPKGLAEGKTSHEFRARK